MADATASFAVPEADAEDQDPSDRVDWSEPDGPGRVVREKEHVAAPMSVDQALHEMELVGHDFYLFSDADSGRACVVYRRHAYEYGLLRLSE